MNLISCTNCAVVLDSDRIEYKKDTYGTYNTDVANCPICSEILFESDALLTKGDKYHAPSNIK